MNDILKILRDYLLDQPALVIRCTDRIYGGRDVPPPGYKPAHGQALVFKVRGGPGYDEEDALLVASVQFKCYGRTEQEADALYRDLVLALHNGGNGEILHALIEGPGVSLEEPETQWPFTLCYFSVLVRQ